MKQPGATRTVIFYGGNIATAARTGLTRARQLAPAGINVVLVDYRNYGGSDTGPTSADIIQADGLLVFDALAARSDLGGPARIIVHGHSMGSLIAGHVAANRPTAGLVLESSATTTEAYAARQVPWYAKPFVRVNIAPGLRAQGNLRIMNQIDEPLLLLVGSRDPDTPPAFSQALYDASPLPATRKRLVVVEGAEHSDVFTHAQAIEAYRAFINSLN